MKYYEKVPSEDGNTTVDVQDLNDFTGSVSSSRGKTGSSRNSSPLKIDDENLVSFLAPPHQSKEFMARSLE